MPFSNSNPFFIRCVCSTTVSLSCSLVGATDVLFCRQSRAFISRFYGTLESFTMRGEGKNTRVRKEEFFFAAVVGLLCSISMKCLKIRVTCALIPFFRTRSW